jgi:hypothetical protein
MPTVTGFNDIAYNSGYSMFAKLPTARPDLEQALARRRL